MVGEGCGPASGWAQKGGNPNLEKVGSRRVGAPKGGGPEGWGPRRVGGPNPTFLSPFSMALNPETMTFREMRSNAPTPSIDTTVAFSSKIVSACNAWVTASVPALVERANWNGELPPTPLGKTAGRVCGRPADARSLRPRCPGPLRLVCSGRSCDPTEWPS